MTALGAEEQHVRLDDVELVQHDVERGGQDQTPAFRDVVVEQPDDGQYSQLVLR